MELWIRTQDREGLFKVDKLWYSYDKQENQHCINNFGAEFGTYKSKERALEVLDEIQNKIKSQYLLKPKTKMELSVLESAKNYYENLNNTDIIICDDNFKIETINTNAIVYEMPKE